MIIRTVIVESFTLEESALCRSMCDCRQAFVEKILHLHCSDSGHSSTILLFNIPVHLCRLKGEQAEKNKSKEAEAKAAQAFFNPR